MIIRIIPNWFPYKAITLAPFILHKRSTISWRTRNHEYIHLRQQQECTLPGFLLVYLVEFLIRLGQYQSWDKAYRNISFEREAYAEDENRWYLSHRPAHAWRRFLRQPSVKK